MALGTFHVRFARTLQTLFRSAALLREPCPHIFGQDLDLRVNCSFRRAWRLEVVEIGKRLRRKEL